MRRELGSNALEMEPLRPARLPASEACCTGFARGCRCPPKSSARVAVGRAGVGLCPL